MRHFRLASLALFAAAAAAVAAPRPTRFVLIVVDQLQADQPARFGMRRVLELARSGTSFAAARVGHLSSETVVSHPVMVTGRDPRHLPWADEALRDARGALGKAGKVWLTTGLSLAQMRTLFAAYPGPEPLPARMRRAWGGSAWAIGAKSYATFGMALGGADHTVTMSGPREDGPWRGLRVPEGEGLPEWLTADARFRVDGHRDYGTAHLEYPMKGDQYLGGPDAAHAGGDLWVADLAVAVMRRDSDWRALCVTMGGVDKVGHMLGEYDGPREAGQDPRVHLARAIREADEAVGRILDELARGGLDSETLVVLTSDHGALTGRMLGDRGPGRANKNWYSGRTENAKFDAPSRAIAPLARHPAVQFVMSDTMVRVWLQHRGPASLYSVARVAERLEGAQGVWARAGERYVRIGGRAAARGTWRGRHQEALFATMPGDHAADLVITLDDGTTYGVPGDHGGEQERVQRIPLIFRGPGVAPGRASRAPARLADIAPTAVALMGLGATAGYDGRPLLPVR